MNGITIAGLTCYDPDNPRALPGINSFEIHTGATRYGFGRFLMRRPDYDTAVATTGGRVNLVMSSQTRNTSGIRESTGGGSVTISVIIAGCNAVSIDVGATTARDMVEVIVFDGRYKSTVLKSKAYNVIRDATASGAARFHAATLNTGSEWTWTTLAGDVASFPSTALVTLPTAWKPRDLILDARSLRSAWGTIADRLMLICGYDWSSDTATLHNPGTPTSANAAMLTAAAPCWLAGNLSQRNAKRLPGKITVTFPAVCVGSAATHDKLDYEKDYTNSAGDADYVESVGVGEYVAVWNGSSWVNQTELDAVAADVGARYVASLSSTIGEAEYAGIWPFKPDGKIRGVRWTSDQHGAKTFLRFNNEAGWSDVSPAKLGRIQAAGSATAAWDGLGGARHVPGGSGGSTGSLPLGTYQGQGLYMTTDNGPWAPDFLRGHA